LTTLNHKPDIYNSGHTATRIELELDDLQKQETVQVPLAQIGNNKNESIWQVSLAKLGKEIVGSMKPQIQISENEDVRN